MIIKALELLHKIVPKLQYRQKIMIVLLVFTLVPFLIIGVVSFRVYMDFKMNELLNEQRELLKKPIDTLDRLYQTSLQKLVLLTNNLPLLQMLREDYRFDLSAYLENIKHVNDIIDAMKSDQTKSNIIVYGLNDTLYSSEYVKKINVLEPGILREIMELTVGTFMWKFSPDDGGTTGSVRIFAKIMDLDRILAVMEIRIPYATVVDMFNYTVPYSGFIVYMNGRNAIPINVNSADSLEINRELQAYKQTGEGKNYRTLEVTITSNGDRAVLFLNERQMFRQYLLLLVVPLAMLVVLVITIYFSVKAVSFLLTKRLAKLMKKMSIRIEQAEEANFLETGGEDEFGIIDRKFQDMVGEIKRHYRRVSEYELQRKLLEMEILQVNINPHFLYNTLSAIKWSYPDNRLAQIIDSLVVYYRIFLNKGQKTLPLFRELEMLRMYMDLQKFSYASDFEYEMDIPDDMLQKPIVKNLIQPIVENCILHGINGLESGGVIRLTGSLENDIMRLVIADNGVGMPQEKVDRMLSEDPAFRQEEADNLRGYGVYNVSQRIKLYYGEQARLDISSRLGQGTAAALILPLL